MSLVPGEEGAWQRRPGMAVEGGSSYGNVPTPLLAETPYYSLQREGSGSLELTFPPAGAQARPGGPGGPGGKGPPPFFSTHLCLFAWVG